ncbi:ribonuclease T1 [Rivibacter subsaxonicus]|uniref:Ribonuclease T1 n=1 Tax=Rivibacter subsaxonicus TaxID=457575 RepID=A0A4Q7VVH8_9BURK|nr:ribonuclease T1 [Rivibacter subsaxonicus]
MLTSGRTSRSSGFVVAAARVLLTAAVLCSAGSLAARTPNDGLEPKIVALAELPPEARGTFRQIRSGGPFPYEKDGIVFGNRERLLPKYPRGYYREYTVRTPGSRDRGARRIVCGGREPVMPDACYYTDDHYASFRLIAQ